MAVQICESVFCEDPYAPHMFLYINQRIQNELAALHLSTLKCCVCCIICGAGGLKKKNKFGGVITTQYFLTKLNLFILLFIDLALLLYI